MSLQGVQTTAVPDDLRVVIEQAQNRITSLEGEVNRLTRLKRSEESDYNCFVVEKAKIVSEIEDAKNELSILRSNGEQIANNNNNLSTENDALNTKKAALLLESANATKELADAKAKFVLAASDVQELEEEKAELVEKNKALALKSAAFLDAVNSLHKSL